MRNEYTPVMSEPLGVHLRRLILPVYLPMSLISLAIAAPSAAFPQYLGSLGAGVAVVGAVISLRGVGNVLSDLPSGIILGRYRLDVVVKISLILATASSVGMALARNVTAIGAFVLINGFMTSVVVTAMMTYVRVRVPAGNRGRALSLVGGSVRIGGVIGPIAGGFLADRLGVPAAIYLRAASFALAFLVVAATDSSHSPAPSNTPREPKKRVDLAAQVRAVVRGMQGRWGALVIVGFAILVLQILRASRSVLLPLWGERLGLTATLIGTVMSTGAALDMVLFVPSGIISDRAGRKVAGGLCIGIFAAGVLSLGFAGGVAGFFLASLIIGMGNGFGAGINMTIGTDLAPDGAVSEFIGLWRLFGDIGASAGPAIVGAIGAAGGLVTAVIATAAIGFVGLVVLLAGPETLTIARDAKIARE